MAKLSVIRNHGAIPERRHDAFLLALLLATLSTPALANADASITAAESTDETQVPDSPWTGSGELGYASARGNSTSESFNGRFRDECLNEHWFETLHQARKEIAAWRRDYNEVRPHGSIGRIPPARFAEQHRRHAGMPAMLLGK